MSLESEMVAFYVEAEKRVLEGKTITRDGKTWGRENLADIRAGRQEWERKLYRTRTPRGPSLAEF
jgi:hypothetical protein